MAGLASKLTGLVKQGAQKRSRFDLFRDELQGLLQPSPQVAPAAPIAPPAPQVAGGAAGAPVPAKPAYQNANPNAAFLRGMMAPQYNQRMPGQAQGQMPQFLNAFLQGRRPQGQQAGRGPTQMNWMGRYR